MLPVIWRMCRLKRSFAKLPKNVCAPDCLLPKKYLLETGETLLTRLAVLPTTRTNNKKIKKNSLFALILGHKIILSCTIYKISVNVKNRHKVNLSILHSPSVSLSQSMYFSLNKKKATPPLYLLKELFGRRSGGTIW